MKLDRLFEPRGQLRYKRLHGLRQALPARRLHAPNPLPPGRRPLIHKNRFAYHLHWGAGGGKELALRQVTAVVPCDPPAGPDGPGAASSGPWNRPAMKYWRWVDAPETQRGPEFGRPFPGAWGSLLPFHHHAGSGGGGRGGGVGDRSDQQSGRAGHPLRGHRPIRDARHTQPEGSELLPTGLDRRGHLHQQARSVYHFFGAAVAAAFNGTRIPSLLPAAP